MRVKLIGEVTLIDTLYPNISDPLFIDRLIQRREFAETRILPEIPPNNETDVETRAEHICNSEFELAPHQIFVRNFLSSRTPYNGLLLYHGLGSGKTCSAITIAEDFRVAQPESRIYIVGNDAVHENFQVQLFDESHLKLTNSGWVSTGCGKSILRDLNLEQVDKRVVLKRAKDLISTHYHFLGYEKLRNEIRAVARSVPEQDVARHLHAAFHDSLFIVDEVHNFLRESTKDFIHLLEVTKVKLLFLSATPMYGDTTDIVDILNMFKINDKIPTIRVQDVFDEEELKDGGVQLADHVRGYVSFVKGDNPYSFPYRIYPKQFAQNKFDTPSKLLRNNPELIHRVDHIDVYTVQCAPKQELAYAKAFASDTIVGDFSMSSPFRLNSLMSLNMSYPGEMYGKAGLASAMKELNGTYTYKSEKCFAPTEIGKYSAKLEKVMQYITGTGIILIYTQFIKGGAIAVALTLEAAGYRRYKRDKMLMEDVEPNGMHYALLSGDAVLSPNNADEIAALVDQNNLNGEKIKVFILTRAASEGVDFKNVRQIHILDPWWHMERIEQIIGRGVRFCSHKRLPFKHRNAMIFLYATLLSDNSEALDMYMYRCAETKAIRIGNVTRLLKLNAIDCILNSTQNAQTAEKLDTTVSQTLSTGKKIKFPIGDKPFTSACDYLDTCPKEDLREINVIDTDVPPMDVGDVIKRIFRTYKVLERDELVLRVQSMSTAPTEAIMDSISRILKQKEHVTDRDGTRGYIVNFGTLYMFQPLNLPLTATMYERRVPPTTVPYSISVNIQEKSITNDVLSKLESEFASRSGWMGRITKFKYKDAIVVAHLIEHLEYAECTQLLSSQPTTQFGEIVRKYFNKNCLFQGIYVLWHTQTCIKKAPELSLRYFRDGKEAEFVSLEMQASINAEIHARAQSRSAICGTISPVNRGEGGRIFKVISEKNPGVACTSIKIGALKHMFLSIYPTIDRDVRRDNICRDLEIALRIKDVDKTRSFITPIEYIVTFPPKKK